MFRLNNNSSHGGRRRWLGALSLLAACLVALGVATPAFAENAVDVTLPFSVETTGDKAPADAKFTFKIEATDAGETLLPTSETVTTKAGDFSFELSGDEAQPAEHHYRVTQVAGSDSAWKYDNQTFDVTVYVGWKDGNAGDTLGEVAVTKIAYDRDGQKLDKAGFTNQYTKPAEPPAPAEQPKQATKKGGASVVKTGDTTRPVWIGVGIVGVIAVGVGVYVRRRRNAGEF